MAANVLNSAHGIEASVFVVCAFSHLRELLATHKQLAQKLQKLEQKHDSQFRAVFDAICAFMAEPERPKSKIGFTEK